MGIKLQDAVVLWNPASRGEPRVCVTVTGDGGNSDTHPCWEPLDRWSPISSTGRKVRVSHVAKMARVLATFHTLVVRDGVPAADVHREFLKIAEYRDCISPDSPGL